MNSPIKLAIVGFGNIGGRHAKVIQENNDCILVAVCDIDEDKLRRIPEHITSYKDLNCLLSSEDFDILCVCTPNGLHKKHTLMALQTQHSVLVEKPLSISKKDGEEIIAYKKLTGLEVFTVMQNRFNPAVIFTKNLLNDNCLGTVLSVQVNCFWNRDESYYKDSNWRGTLDMDGGVIYTQFSHFVDIMCSFWGKMKVLSGFISNKLHTHCSQLADMGTFILQAGDILINFNFTINAFQKNMEGSITIFGDKGTVKVGGQYLNQIAYCEIENLQNYQAEIDRINAAKVINNQYGTYQGSMSNHDKVFQSMVNHLLFGDKYYTSIEEGLVVVEIIENMYASAQKF